MIDKEKVTETILFAENDSSSYEALYSQYLPALLRKIKAGKYDRKKAPKLLEYYYSNYVRGYMKNPRNYGFDPKLNPEERTMFAKYFVDVLHDEHLNKAIRAKKRASAIPKAKRKLKK